MEAARTDEEGSATAVSECVSNARVGRQGSEPPGDRGRPWPWRHPRGRCGLDVTIAA